jgi:prophage tail gpP-like protein
MASFEDLHRVRLRVVGKDYVNWTTVDISYGIETAARSFAFTATQPDQSTVSPVDFQLGDPFELFVGQRPNETKLITGFIDAIAPSYDANSSSIAVTGRSKTADLVDCSVIGKHRFNNRFIEHIAATLAEPYGVNVVVGNGVTGEPIRKFVPEQGESVYDAIERACRLRGLLIFDDADGNLILWQSTPGAFPLQLGAQLRRGGERANILDGSGSFDASNVYSEYRCKGQTAATDFDFGAAASNNQGIASDAGLGRTRIKIIPAESGANKARCAARAAWDAANALMTLAISGSLVPRCRLRTLSCV